MLKNKFCVSGLKKKKFLTKIQGFIGVIFFLFLTLGLYAQGYSELKYGNPKFDNFDYKKVKIIFIPNVVSNDFKVQLKNDKPLAKAIILISNIFKKAGFTIVDYGSALNKISDAAISNVKEVVIDSSGADIYIEVSSIITKKNERFYTIDESIVAFNAKSRKQLSNIIQDTYSSNFEYLQSKQQDSIKLERLFGKMIEKVIKNSTPICIRELSSNLVLESQWLIYRSKNKYGVLDLKGDTVLKPIYDSILCIKSLNENFIVRKNLKWAFFTEKGLPLTPFEFDNIAFSSEKKQKLYVRQYDKWATSDENGQLISWYNLNDDVDSEDDHGKQYYFRIDGNYCYPIMYNPNLSVSTNNNATSVNKKNGFSAYKKFTLDGVKLGLLNAKMDTLTQPIYDDIVLYETENYISVIQNNKEGLIDFNGKTIIPCVHDKIGSYNESEKRVFVMKNNLWALIDNKNNLLTDYIYESFGKFQSGLVKVKSKKGVGYIGIDGKQKIPCKFSDGTDFINDFGIVYFDEYHPVILGEAFRNINGKEVSLGIIDAGQMQKVPFIITKSGNIIYKGGVYDNFIFSKQGVFLVKPRVNNSFETSFFPHLLIDSTGKIIIPASANLKMTIYDDWIQTYNPNLDKFGLLDFKGKQLLATKFFFVTYLWYNNNSLAKVYFDLNNYIYIDKSGKCENYDGIKCP